jgi:hypothetical protein
VATPTEEKKLATNNNGFRWTLTYSGKDKVYTLAEFQQVGEEFYRTSETQWRDIDAALTHIRNTNGAREKGAQG